MSLSIIYLAEYLSFENIRPQFTPFIKEEIQKGNLQVIFLDNGTQKNNLKNINVEVEIIPKNNFKFTDIKSDYLMIIDKEHAFDDALFKGILKKLNTVKEIDILQLSSFGNSESEGNLQYLRSNYEEISSIKIIHKSLLNKVDGLVFEGFNRVTLTHLYFELFANALDIQMVEDIYYAHPQNNTIEAIINECDIINHLISSKVGLEQKKFLILFKRALVVKLFNMLDSRNFVDLLPYEQQEKILVILRKLLMNIDDASLKTWNLSGYIPFAQMVREELYSEALYYIRILRGKRYWFNTSQELEAKIKNYPIEESLSWKVSAPLRKSTELINNFAAWLFKWCLLFFSIPFKLKYLGKEVWLVSERADQAEDNGYEFFKYCRENYPSKKVYYIINKDSVHVDKIKKLGNVVYHSSLKHWIYLLVAKKYISGWVFEETSYPLGKFEFSHIFQKLLKKKLQVTLQHGVIIHNIAPYLSKELYNQSLFIASSYAEKEVIKATLGYSDKDVAVTGLARFDNLHNLTVKKQILIMPTWRRSLFRLNHTEFLNSDYFKRYYNLVRNPAILRLIEKHNIQLKFYVHSQMQKFIDEFAYKHPNIHFLTKEDAVVSDLLKESSLLITDYSSVMADFLYMEKPVLLYQFDPYNNHHGPVNEIKYSDFGEVYDEEEELVNKIKDIAKQDFKISEKYLNKSNDFFAYKDTDNSKRIYEAIQNLRN